MTFTNSPLDNSLSEFLRKQKIVRVRVAAPNDLVASIDIDADEFDTKGYAVAEQSAQRTCRNTSRS